MNGPAAVVALPLVLGSARHNRLALPHQALHRLAYARLNQDEIGDRHVVLGIRSCSASRAADAVAQITIDSLCTPGS
jgi:hypothetical protein